MAKFCSSNLIVYLDAPYKRDEYSRYYHVLETIALYDYPASERKGRLRTKNNGERFKTEFFSKNIQVVEINLKHTIVTIIQKSKACVWSYSDNGVASIPNVVNMVLKEVPCKVYFYSIPHKHNSQRKKEKTYKAFLNVMEYCIVFVKEL
ncbi:MAG: DNA adenine methylase [Lachnospira sp.]|nr:DNA adenine methylase [Lachnospira sp.]